jgi:PilZ domain.
MVEKRKFPRFQCKLKTKFNFHEGNPEEIDYEIMVPTKGKGVICDISQGGALLITSGRVSVGVPALLSFKTKKNKHAVHGHIVRTGMLRNNPTEVAQRMAKFSSLGDSYIAVEFKEPIEFNRDEL